MITDKKVFADVGTPYLHRYAQTHSEFLIEDVREWAYANGLDEPTDHRWWSQISNRGVRLGYMEKAAMQISRSKKGTYYRALWRSKVR